MLLNVVHGQVQESQQKPITKRLPTIPLTLTMISSTAQANNPRQVQQVRL